tara:strand:+ start:677 stop:1102 length:426 start_codon:yes stop_codon:yes gene_type:complete
MTALSADKTRTVAGNPTGFRASVAGSATIYQGALLAAAADGYAQPATDTASLAILGIACDNVDNSSGNDGDKEVTIQRGQIEKIAHSALTVADVGKNVVVEDDATVTDGAAATNDLKVGTLVGFEDGDALVLIGVFADVDA